MSLIDQKYTESLIQLTGKEKVERTFSLFGSICEMLSLQLKREFHDLSDRELKIKIAQRLYLSDKDTQHLIHMASLL